MTQTNGTPNFLKSEALDYLKSASVNGLWPYEANRQPALEPSCWAAIALRRDDEARRNFLTSFLSRQNKDGGFPSAGPPSNWLTGLGLFTLRTLDEFTKEPQQLKTNKDSFNRALNFLMENRADYYNVPGKILLMLAYGPQYDYARGWPWTQQTFDWVEPTSYVLFALGDNPTGDGQVATAVAKAREFLLKTAIKNGGWDFCARNPDDPVHIPYPYNTAQALLALGDMRQKRAVRESLKYLQQSSPLHDTVLSLSWSAIALHAFGEDITEKITKLHAHQKPDGSFGTDNLATALACIAITMEEQGNPLRLRKPNA